MNKSLKDDAGIARCEMPDNIKIRLDNFYQMAEDLYNNRMKRGWGWL